MITRYEEYLCNEKDEFQRFPHTHSLAYKNNFLSMPLVDKWLMEFKEVLQNKYSQLFFEESKFSFLPTYDIDIAYSFRNKGLRRNAAGFLKSMLTGNLKKRITVLRGNEKDPYDSFDFLESIHKEFHLNPIYFILLGNGRNLDKNNSIKNKEFISLIKRIGAANSVGIHPSYLSNDRTKNLASEIKKLIEISGKEITKSRQHYIRFALPDTYLQLIKQGIKSDYSMGYGSTNGFRASTSNPFNWFNLHNNNVEKLRIYPFCFMECNSFFEQKQTLYETKYELEKIITEVKNVNGKFISIWHNFSLGTDSVWVGWRDVYLYQLKLLSNS